MMFLKAFKIGLLSVTAILTVVNITSAKSLKASHQWPGGKGDVRDIMVQMIAEEVAKANVDLNIKVYPGKSLFKPKDQWQAMVKGQLDISAFPLDYASGYHPQFSATLMPGLVKNHDHALRLNNSPFMDDIKKIINDAGVVVLSDAWLAGGFASKKNCILGPETMKGQVTRAAGPAFEQMLVGAVHQYLQCPVPPFIKPCKQVYLMQPTQALVVLSHTAYTNRLNALLPLAIMLYGLCMNPF
jgi:TRAP-type C4-dicarboxylate transport system substrate-binding protein